MPAMNRAEQAAVSHWSQTGERLPLLVLDLDRGEAYHCRPVQDGAQSKLLQRMIPWPDAGLTEAEIDRSNPAMRRYIASGRHPLRDEGCSGHLADFERLMGGPIDRLCESAVASAQLPFRCVLIIGRLSRFYPAEHRVRCMLSFAPLAPDDSLHFLGTLRGQADLLGHEVALQVLMRRPDGSVAGESLTAAQPDTPLDQLTGDALPGLPAMLAVPEGEVRLLVDGRECRVPLAGLGLPGQGAMVAVGLSVRDGRLMCHLNGRALKHAAVCPVTTI